MSYRSVETLPSLEHFKFNTTLRGEGSFINHRFNEATLVEHTHGPGLYITMLGKCNCLTFNDGMDREMDYSYQYMVALVDKPSACQMHFPRNTAWQTLSIMLPLDTLHECSMIPEFQANFAHDVPQIRLAELGPIPRDILNCCETVWDCPLQGPERDLFIQAKAQEILALFLYQRRKQKQTPEKMRIVKLRRALNHIQTNLAQEWSLSSVARLAGSNRTYVKQDIKMLVGLSFSDWLRQTRLEAACKRLAGSAPITEVSLNVGFKSQAHFATLFKNEIGVTPSEYRQSL